MLASIGLDTTCLNQRTYFLGARTAYLIAEPDLTARPSVRVYPEDGIFVDKLQTDCGKHFPQILVGGVTGDHEVVWRMLPQ